MISVPLHRSLIKNYIFFMLTMLVTAILSLLFLGLTVNSQMAGTISPRITASDIVRADYANMDTSDIRQMDGWVEILDEENRVVSTLGEKQTPDHWYDNRQLYTMLSFEGNGKPYICTAKAFQDENGRKLTCLVFLPRKSADLQINLIKSPLPVAKQFLTLLGISLLFFLGILLLNIHLYSKWSARKISRPLKKITEALQELRKGRLETRMEFQAENEFLQIRDAFNEMAEKLESGQAEKRRLEEARNRMFMDISHDLKTPVTVINAYSRALAENMVKEESQKQRYMETICRKSARVSNLIESLFDLAKLENGRGILKREETDLSEFLRGIAAEYYEQIEEGGLLLDLQLPEERIPCPIDRKEMSRVVSNLLSNAIRYNPAGTVIHIGLTVSRDEVAILVGDNGAGIPEGLKETLFEPFVRGDPSRGSEGGTGLGLAIAKKIVENHGGSIVLVSDSKYKTMFRIVLPVLA